MKTPALQWHRTKEDSLVSIATDGTQYEIFHECNHVRLYTEYKTYSKSQSLETESEAKTEAQNHEDRKFLANLRLKAASEMIGHRVSQPLTCLFSTDPSEWDGWEHHFQYEDGEHGYVMVRIKIPVPQIDEYINGIGAIIDAAEDET